MKYALFLGCKIPSELPAYGAATRAVLERLDVTLVDPDFGCCGYPARNLHLGAYLLSSARNLALAEQTGLDVLTPCKCCYGSLRHAAHLLERNETLRASIDRELAAEGLRWTGGVRVKHLLSVLTHDVGLDAIRTRITAPQRGLRVAPHYGCHALRPSDVVQLDNPLAPTIFENLVAVTGAQSVDWPRRLDCCGSPLLEANEGLSLAMMRSKVADAREAGADYLCTACTWCQMQFDAVQTRAATLGQRGARMPALLYPQLLGLALGLPPEALGL